LNQAGFHATLTAYPQRFERATVLIVNRTVRIVNRTVRIVNRTVLIVNRTVLIVNRTVLIVNRVRNASRVCAATV
jgi:hypothetical protein